MSCLFTWRTQAGASVQIERLRNRRWIVALQHASQHPGPLSRARRRWGLALSLNHLASRLSENGRHEQALVVSEEAVENWLLEMSATVTVSWPSIWLIASSITLDTGSRPNSGVQA